MNPKLLLGLALVLSGGLLAGCDTDRLPSQKGTWIGIAEPVTLYDLKREPHQVLKLVIQEGPKYWGEGPLNGQFIFPYGVIVDKKYRTVEMNKYAGQRLKIRGTIVIASVIDRNDGIELMWTTPRLDYEHMNPPAALATSKIVILATTNALSGHQP